MAWTLPRPGRAALAFAFLSAGCGGTDWSVPRLPVSGTVKLGGEPLAKGQLSFVPLESGPAASAEIVGGAYSIPGAEGPAAGPYRVEIRSVEGTGKKVFDRDENREIDEVRDLVSSNYNSASKLKVDVKAAGPNTFDFDVEPPRRRGRSGSPPGPR